jgi:hypothetical protein
MGFLQDVVWNNVFDYAYPITFIGALYYAFIHAFDIEASTLLNDNKIRFIANIFFGLCALLSFASWFNTDLSSINKITSYIDLNASQTVSEVKTSN